MKIVVKDENKVEHSWSKTYGHIGFLTDSLAECQEELKFEPHFIPQVEEKLIKIRQAIESVDYEINELRRYLKMKT